MSLFKNVETRRTCIACKQYLASLSLSPIFKTKEEADEHYEKMYNHVENLIVLSGAEEGGRALICVAATMYFDCLYPRMWDSMDSKVWARVLVGIFVLLHKMLFDDFYSNKAFARAFKVDLKNLNEWELKVFINTWDTVPAVKPFNLECQRLKVMARSLKWAFEEKYLCVQ
jgi:hypothetical protein